MPAKKDMPSTVQRSSKKAQRTWVETHDSAVDQYGEGERAHRTAFSAVKHSFEKVGDRWEAKEEKGPSDKQAEKSGAEARRGDPAGREVRRHDDTRAGRRSEVDRRHHRLQAGQGGRHQVARLLVPGRGVGPVVGRHSA